MDHIVDLKIRLQFVVLLIYCPVHEKDNHIDFHYMHTSKGSRSSHTAANSYCICLCLSCMENAGCYLYLASELFAVCLEEGLLFLF